MEQIDYSNLFQKNNQNMIFNTQQKPCTTNHVFIRV